MNSEFKVLLFFWGFFFVTLIFGYIVGLTGSDSDLG